MKIQVTEENIREGNPKDVQFCPVALALRREFPRASIAVTYTYIRIGYIWYRTPASVADFIENYDHDFHVAPFTFNLKLISEDL